MSQRTSIGTVRVVMKRLFEKSLKNLNFVNESEDGVFGR